MRGEGGVEKRIEWFCCPLKKKRLSNRVFFFPSLFLLFFLFGRIKKKRGCKMNLNLVCCRHLIKKSKEKEKKKSIRQKPSSGLSRPQFCWWHFLHHIALPVEKRASFTPFDWSVLCGGLERASVRSTTILPCRNIARKILWGNPMRGVLHCVQPLGGWRGCERI